MDLVLIEQGCPEWEYMWEWLSNHPINEGIINPSLAEHNGEAWQYMGSYKQGDRVLHSFRHRNHPITLGVKNLSLMASELLTNDQIQKTFRL